MFFKTKAKIDYKLYLDEKKDEEGLSFKGFDLGACHESQIGRENGNAIDVVKFTEMFFMFS